MHSPEVATVQRTDSNWRKSFKWIGENRFRSHGFHAGLLPQRPLSPLSHNQFVQLDIETPAWHRLGIRIIHRCRMRLEDEHPQLGKILTTIVKIGEAVPAADSLADPVSSPGQSSAKAGSEPSLLYRK
jgi:hypothetical protein